MRFQPKTISFMVFFNSGLEGVQEGGGVVDSGISSSGSSGIASEESSLTTLFRGQKCW